MSSIGFLTRDGEARVSGREHAKFRGLLGDLAWQQFATAFELDRHPDGTPGARQVVAWPDYVHEAGRTGLRGGTFAGAAKLTLGAGYGSQYVRTPDGPSMATLFDVTVNSVVATTDDLTTLAVRLVAQCEVNAWIDGTDRAWLADLIDTGRRTPWPIRDDEYARNFPMFADEPSINGHYDGWAGVVDFLRAGDGTVVLDYSVTDGFPDADWAAYPEETNDLGRRRFNTATGEQRWDASELGLRQYTRDICPLLRIQPATLHHAAYGEVDYTWTRLGQLWNTTPATT